jgi:methylthioribose-1-phosphate isomerase
LYRHAPPRDPRETGYHDRFGRESLFTTVKWDGGAVLILDQRRLPDEEAYLRCLRPHEVAVAIKDMAIRGAPAIGVAAAMGLALGATVSPAEGVELKREMDRVSEELLATRPTAVNLSWAIERMQRRFEQHAAEGGEPLRQALIEEALAIQAEDEAACRRMGDLGAALIPHGARLLTHCNAGALATAGYGTALGIVRSAARDGKVRNVFADETRPYLQGARLTAWELSQDGIPVTVIADNMAGHLLSRGEVDAVVVGADRIAANGDVANKIGTYTLAVLAHENGVPFYVAAPVSTFDLTIATGDRIPIEERSPEEVTHHGGRRLTPEGVPVRNPAFDVTPHRYVGAIVCERGVARPPYEESLRALAGMAATREPEGP